MKKDKSISLAVPSDVSPLGSIAGTFTQLDADAVVLSPYSNRMPSDPSDRFYLELRSLVALTGGNVTPAVVSVEPDPQEPTRDIYVLISGHRVWEVCKELNLKLNVVLVKGLSALEVTRHMSMSNSGRKSLSALEAGRSFVKYLEAKLFINQAELARELGVAPSDVSNAIKLARLPDIVIAAFASPDDLQHRFAKELTDALKADEKKVLACARRLAKRQATLVKKMSALEVFDELAGNLKDKLKTAGAAKPEAAVAATASELGKPASDAMAESLAHSGKEPEHATSTDAPSNVQERVDTDAEPEAVPASSSRPLLSHQVRAEASSAVRPSTEWPVTLGNGPIVGTMTRFETGAIRIDLQSQMGLTQQHCIDLLEHLSEFLEPRAFGSDTSSDVDVDVEDDDGSDADGDDQDLISD